jgi:hypothetical protein
MKRYQRQRVRGRKCSDTAVRLKADPSDHEYRVGAWPCRIRLLLCLTARRAYTSTSRGEGGAGSLKFKTK